MKIFSTLITSMQQVSQSPISKSTCPYSVPVDTGRTLNVHKTFRIRPGRLLNVLYTFSLRPVSTGLSPLYQRISQLSLQDQQNGERTQC